MSQITTHILDITKGKPVASVVTILYVGANDVWTELARGKTDNDGRLSALLKPGEPLQHGIYKIRFETKDYFDQLPVPTFYPYVEIIFEINTTEHYHVPLLLSPFGYSTYRGS